MFRGCIHVTSPAKHARFTSPAKYSTMTSIGANPRRSLHVACTHITVNTPLSYIPLSYILRKTAQEPLPLVARRLPNIIRE